jgi:hypothetical protein
MCCSSQFVRQNRRASATPTLDDANELSHSIIQVKTKICASDDCPYMLVLISLYLHIFAACKLLVMLLRGRRRCIQQVNSSTVLCADGVIQSLDNQSH